MHKLDEVLFGHQEVVRLGDDGKDDAERAPDPLTLQRSPPPTSCVNEAGSIPPNRSARTRCRRR